MNLDMNVIAVFFLFISVFFFPALRTICIIIIFSCFCYFVFFLHYCHLGLLNDSEEPIM